MKAKKEEYWGFDLKDIDRSVRPQDDFYHYANGGWIKQNSIPEDEARWGSFTMLRYKTEHQLKDLIHTLLKKRHSRGTPEQLVADYYRSAIDMPRRNRLGAKPIEPLRSAIRAVQTKDELLSVISLLHLQGFGGFWNLSIDQDFKNSEKYLLLFWQGGLGLPDRDYYLEDKPEQKRVRDAYRAHIKKLSRLAGASLTEAREIEHVVIDIETRLAKASMKKEDTRDPEKVYHKMSLSKFSKEVPGVAWKEYLKALKAPNVQSVMVGQPDFFKAVSTLLETYPLESLKQYLEWHLINGAAGLLSEPFVEEHFNFYAKTLSGVKKMKPLWRRALAATSGALSEALGKLYVREYFPASSKRAMDTLVNDLFVVYKKRIEALSWMSPKTRRKALLKLRSMRRKIGYPKKFRTYRGVVISPTDYFGNALRVNAHEHEYQMHKLRKPVDKNEWHMSPQTVNAYYNPGLNEIVFPAAILQWPFFDPHADDAVNYAGIGSVIGHEITHGFDDQGSKFDHRGNMKSWWSKSDQTHFAAKTKPFIVQAAAQEVAPGIPINGHLTLGENMADSGGLSIAYDAYQEHLKKKGRRVVAGLPPEERFFLGFAQMEREVVRPEFLKMITLTDPHPVNYWRINGPLSNFEPFYETFGLQKSDKLYRPPHTRAQVW